MSCLRELELILRWPWALLEGVQAYALEDKVAFGRSVLTLSGIGAIVIEGEKLKAEGIQDILCELAT